ncbi:chorismate mutase [Roseixanthobacter glucoisosaccharinicivorans]|uniref:chorismate mutase n=1 Tax=Roseixanthobacter glucoisosaccharinicivorans TaxID=3119923 RepID=UPI00372CE400
MNLRYLLVFVACFSLLAIAGAKAQGTPAPRSLEVLRAEIDRVDGEVLALLNARAAIVAEVGAGKATSGGPVFRPGRQAALLRRLLSRNAGPQTAQTQTAQTLVQVWTAIIAGSILQQKPDFRVAVAGDGDEARLAQSFFGAAIPQSRFAKPAEALEALVSGQADAAVLPAGGSWWLDVPQGVRIVAAAPLLRAKDAPAGALILTRSEGDPSGADLMLVRLSGAPPAGGTVLARAGANSLVALPPASTVPPGATALGLMAAPLTSNP